MGKQCPSCGGFCKQSGCERENIATNDTSTKRVDETGENVHEPIAWISVKDALPKAVRGLSHKRSMTDVVLVRHSDRPDYPITAHAVVGEGLGSGIAIPTEGASEHPEIAWYSQCRDLNNPFDLKNDKYDRYLPKIFGTKITHWMPITTPPQSFTYEQVKAHIQAALLSSQPQRTWVGLHTMTIMDIYQEVLKEWRGGHQVNGQIVFAKAIEQALKERNT